MPIRLGWATSSTTLCCCTSRSASTSSDRQLTALCSATVPPSAKRKSCRYVRARSVKPANRSKPSRKRSPRLAATARANFVFDFLAQFIKGFADFLDRCLWLGFEADQLVPRLAVDPDQLVKLQLDGLRVAPLRVLDQKNHDQRDDRGSCVDDQLPGVRPAVKRTRGKPQNNKRDRRDRCAGPRYLLFAPAGKAREETGRAIELQNWRARHYSAQKRAYCEKRDGRVTSSRS